MGTLFQDVKYGLRMLRRSPGFTAVAVLSLALGIGANTAIYSLINAVMLRVLAVDNPRQLVQLASAGPLLNTPNFPYHAFERFRDESHVFSGVLAESLLSDLDASINGQAELVDGRIVSGNFFSLLGVHAVAGRTFTADEDKALKANPVVVISYNYWKRRFGMNASIVGQTVSLHGSTFTIIGVTPSEFFGLRVGRSPDIYVPMMMEPVFRDGESWLNHQDFFWLQIMGRLKPGVSLQQARADSAVIFNGILADWPKQGFTEKDRKDFLASKLDVVPAAGGLVFDLRKEFSGPLVILMGMVGLVLLIACANVANLLLARATTRRKEIAVRLAIGAGRVRLIRQLLTESVMLAVAGGALGLVLAYWGSDAIVALMAIGRGPILLDLHPDLRVLAFTAVVSLFAGTLFGLAPAFRATQFDLTPSLKENARGLSAGRTRLGLGNALVVSQVALSLLLLFGAGLFLRTLRNLQSLDPGFNRDNVLLFSIDPTKSGYKGAAVTTLYKQVLERIDSIPGVRSASLSEMTPVTGGGGWDNPVWVQGYTSRPDEDMNVYLNSVGPRFFETFKTPILMGREFGSGDTKSSPKVAIVNQAMAQYFFGKSNPIGEKFGWGQGKESTEFEIVGVVKDAKYTTLRDQVPRTAYLDCFQGPQGSMTFEVRTAIRPMAVAPAIRSQLQAISKDIRIGEFSTMDEHVEDSLGHERLMATLASLFGGLALVLAALGLYGVLSYAVARRTNEIGVRMALGAQQSGVLWMVMRETLLLVLVGVAIGLPMALAATRLISSMLFGLKPTDPVTISLALLVLAAVAAIAGYLPARRASKVDPMVALRYE